MQVHPEVARLRGVGAPQPRCDAALAAWRARPEVAAIMAALARYDAGDALEDIPALSLLTRDHDAARVLVGGLTTMLIDALRAEPLAQLPLGHSAAPGMARLRLASAGRATLTLAAYTRRAHSLPKSVLFEDCAVHELVVAGAGRAALHSIADGRLVSEERALAPGTRLTRDGPDAARQIIAVTQPLLMLQLTHEPLHPAPSREVALADGRLLKTISGCKRTSQQLMALAVLGALGHRAADRDLRWEALRQCLALDAARGMTLLAALTGDGDDALAAPAAALHHQLLARRPDLAALIPEPA
jgi:hypothetical protein